MDAYAGRALCGALAALAVATLSAPTVARANGRFPAADMLVVDPRDPMHLALRATYGVLVSNDGGTTWGWVCERAVGYASSEDPALAISSNGVLLAGMGGKLARSSDLGCTWPKAESAPEGVVDMTLRPSEPARVYALTSRPSGVGERGRPRFRSELVVSNDAGATFTSRAVLDPALTVLTIDVAPSSPRRVYVSATRDGEAPDSVGVLLVANDDGRTWSEHRVELSRGERGLFIAAVDPKHDGRLYLRTGGFSANRLFVSDDAGTTTRPIFSGTALLGFALADGGDTVYVGSRATGVHRASTRDFRFEARDASPVQCLLATAGKLWECAPATGGSVLRVSTDGGATFVPKLTLSGRGPLACLGDKGGAACSGEWAALGALEAQIAAPRAGASATARDGAVPDAGYVEASATKDAAPTRRSPTCGCELTGRDGAPHGGCAVLLGALAAFAGRRRARGLESQ